MVKLIQGIENRIYSNAAAARKAKCIMNAIGVMLQELPALLESLDEDKDGCQYVLFDIGKLRMAFSCTLEQIKERTRRWGKTEGEEGHKRDCTRPERERVWPAMESKLGMTTGGDIRVFYGIRPVWPRGGPLIIYRTLFQRYQARWTAGRCRGGPTGSQSWIRATSKWRAGLKQKAGEEKTPGSGIRSLYLQHMKDEIKWIIIITPVIYVFVCWKAYIYVSEYLIFALYSCGSIACLDNIASYVVRYSRCSPVGPAKNNIYPNSYIVHYVGKDRKPGSRPGREKATGKGGGPIGPKWSKIEEMVSRVYRS